MSHAVAKVISDIIMRLQAHHGVIPLLRRLDRSEREFSQPMPFLFQHHYNSGAGAVFSDATIRKYLAPSRRPSGSAGQ